VPSFKRASINAHASGDLALEQRRNLAVATLRNEGARLSSPTLSAIAMQVAANPFAKMKKLIQKLVERLLAEATAEATKKGFCDTELGKAENDRDFRWTEVKKLSAELKLLEAKEDSLKSEIDMLTTNLEALADAVKEATEDRAEEKKNNEKTIDTASKGLTAVKEALLILKTFYKNAAKAAFVQVKASPVDEEIGDNAAGFSGSYKGQQQSSNAVLGLLETIASDFDRTVRTTEAAEKSSAAEFVEFMRTSKADIAGKETKKELDEQDLETTLSNIKTNEEDLKTNMGLVDDALKVLTELKPTCIDTGMSYEERVAKRKEEMEALKKALCVLDTEKVEADCQGGP